MLAIGRALVLNPRLLLLDEPLEGLAPIIVEELLRALSRLFREEGMAAIIVEQHAQTILGDHRPRADPGPRRDRACRRQRGARGRRRDARATTSASPAASAAIADRDRR